MSTSIQTVDYIIHARWILPIVPSDKLYERCALLIKHDRITAIVTNDVANKDYTTHRPEDRLYLDHHCLMPGLINMHGHAAMSLMRGYADDMPLDKWLEEAIWPAEAKHVSADFVRAGTELAIAEMLLSGTTTFSDMYFYPDESAAAASRAGMRANVFFPVLDFPSVWARDADDYMQKGLAIADEYRSSDLITVGFGPHAPYTVSCDPLTRIATLSEEMDALVHIHLHETEQNVQDSLQRYGKRPIERLDELGLLSCRLHAVHMTATSPQDLSLLAEHQVNVIHCPASNMKLASGFAAIDAMHKSGVNIALGTDGAASNNQLDLFAEMRLASLIAKGHSGDARALSASTALETVTINAAKALGRENDLGSLGEGKLADVIAIDLRDIAQQPLLSNAPLSANKMDTRRRLISQLVYTAVGHKVSHAWVNGRLLLRERRLLNGIYERAQSALQYALM